MKIVGKLLLCGASTFLLFSPMIARSIYETEYQEANFSNLRVSGTTKLLGQTTIGSKHNHANAIVHGLVASHAVKTHDVSTSTLVVGSHAVKKVSNANDTGAVCVKLDPCHNEFQGFQPGQGPQFYSPENMLSDYEQKSVTHRDAPLSYAGVGMKITYMSIINDDQLMPMDFITWFTPENLNAIATAENPVPFLLIGIPPVFGLNAQTSAIINAATNRQVIEPSLTISIMVALATFDAGLGALRIALPSPEEALILYNQIAANGMTLPQNFTIPKEVSRYHANEPWRPTLFEFTGAIKDVVSIENFFDAIWLPQGKPNQTTV